MAFQNINPVLLVLTLTIFSTRVTAQDKIYGGLGGFIIGGEKLAIGRLNTSLQNAGYKQFSDQALSFGGGGYAIINRFMIGGEGHSFSGQDKLSDDLARRVKLSGRYAMVSIGYVVFAPKGWIVYPLVGLGNGSFGLTIDNRGNLPFDGVLTNPEQSVKLKAEAFIVNFSMNVQRFLLSEGDGGLIGGLQIGYNWMPQEPDWKWSGGSIDAGPDIRMNGPFIRLVFGGAGLHHQRNKHKEN